MKPGRKKWKRLWKKLRLYIVVIAFLSLLGGAFHAVLRETLLKNFQDLGTALAKSYVWEENNNLTVYETLLTFGTESINVRLEQGQSPQEIESWLGMYYERLQYFRVRYWRQTPGKGIAPTIFLKRNGISRPWQRTVMWYSQMFT